MQHLFWGIALAVISHPASGSLEPLWTTLILTVCLSALLTADWLLSRWLKKLTGRQERRRGPRAPQRR